MSEGASTAPAAAPLYRRANTGADRARRNSRMPVRRSFLLLLTLALVPLLLLALGRGYLQLQRSRERIQVEMVAQAGETARWQAEVVRTARVALLLLADQPDVRSGGILCDMALVKVTEGFAAFSNAARFGADGALLCSSHPSAAPIDLSQKSWWPVTHGGKFLVIGPIWGEASQRQVLAAIMPVANEHGDFDGVVTISIDLGWIERSLRSRELAPDAVVLLLDGDGHALAGNRNVRFGRLDVALAAGSIGDVRDADGRRWTYAVAPLVSGRDGSRPLFVAYAVPEARLFSAAWWQAGLSILQPLVAIALVSLGIWYGTNRLVLRWLRELHQVADAFSAGDYRPRGNFRGAPSEFRDLAAAFSKMGLAIERRDTELHTALDRQNQLIRETHHRVKNNLQIVMSLLGLQVDRLETVAGRAAMSQIRLRISTLALVHRLLYETGETARMSSTKLLGGVCDLLTQNLARRTGIEVHCSFADRDIDIDTAIPLALWLTEATSNAMLHAFPAETPGEIRLTLAFCGESGVLEVRDNGVGFAHHGAAGQQRGLRIMAGIARQLGGSITTESGAGIGTRICLVYPLERPAKTAAAA